MNVTEAVGALGIPLKGLEHGLTCSKIQYCGSNSNGTRNTMGQIELSGYRLKS